MYVELFETTADGQVPWFKVYLVDGKVDIGEAPKKLQHTWNKYGIPFPPRSKPVKPSDGEVFLTAVARDYHGSIARANNVRDDEEETISS
jgi:hypothetical protein